MFLFFLILSVWFLCCSKTFGQENSQDSNNWSILDKIEEGKGILAESPALRFVERNGALTKREIALAVLNTRTGKVIERRYWLNELEIIRANSARKRYISTNNLPRFLPGDDLNFNYSVSASWWNNFNSEISITAENDDDSSGFIIVANKYLMLSVSIPNPEDRSGKKYTDVIYSPYSKNLHRGEVIKRGKQFLEESINLAFNDLRQRRVLSRAFPGKLVVDTIRPSFIKTLLIVEQTDPRLFFKASDEDKRRIAERVVVRYGLNCENTFRYTYSNKGALGPVQIMPLTYSYPRRIVRNRKRGGTGMVQMYPDAGLIQNVNIGRIDVVNAIKAAMLVSDDHMVYVKERVLRSSSNYRKIFESKSEDELDLVRAMIYNGGPGKYSLITGYVNKRVRGWRESYDFVRKFIAIRDMNLFD